MGIFDKFKKDKPPEAKADFSNVRSGGTSTAPAAPAPTTTFNTVRDDHHRHRRSRPGVANRHRTFAERGQDDQRQH